LPKDFDPSTGERAIHGLARVPPPLHKLEPRYEELQVEGGVLCDPLCPKCGGGVLQNGEARTSKLFGLHLATTIVHSTGSVC